MKQVKSFITRCYNKENDIPYCWYNRNKLVDERDIKSLQEYLNDKKEIEYLLIVSGIEETRPQRTFCSLPEFFRPCSMFRYYVESIQHNTFIFAISRSNSEWMEYKEKDILSLKNLFPKKATITLLKKEGVL